MAPLILHNVPDEELYIGEDGVQRPYAMIYPQQDGPTTVRNRRAVPETGAFGKSTRRSRSKTATPAKREDPTIQAAQKLFNNWFDTQKQPTDDKTDSSATTQKQRRSSVAQPSNPTSSSPADDSSPSADALAAAAARNIPKVPTEVILRGFKDVDQQYASISRYEHIAGRICEDYPRDPPYEVRRYKSELRDPAYTRPRALLTTDERLKVNRANSGNHWVKVTFESQQAADAALFASPQAILGHLVYAEAYHGMPPARDEPVPDATTLAQGDEVPSGWRRAGFGGNQTAAELRQPFGADGRLPEQLIAPEIEMDMSPPHSHASSRTVESATVGTTTSTSTTMTGNNGAIVAETAQPPRAAADNMYCRTITSARRAVLLPAEQALLPQPSLTARVLDGIPFLGWFSGSMIGSQVPRTTDGDFDWVAASMYWKIICWLDLYFRLFGGEIASPDKED